MPKSKKTSASATVTKSAIDHATSILEELPEKPKENWSLREAVAHLQVQISSTLAKGYSYEEIAGMLTEKGIDISASSLKSYLSAAKRQKDQTGKTGRTGRRSRKALSESTIVEPAVAAAAPADSNGAESESISEPTESDAPRKRRTRSTAASSQKPASKTAAKSKAAPQTKSTAAAKSPTKRGRRQA